MEDYMELEVLNFVKEFYQNAWDKLIFVISIAFTAIGIFMGIILPVVLQFLQERRNKKERDALKKEIFEFNNRYKKKMKNKINLLNKDARFNEGSIHVTQAIMFGNNKSHIYALFSYISAYQCFLKADRVMNVNMAFFAISTILSNKLVDITNLQPPESTTLKMCLIDTIQLFEKLDNNGLFLSHKQVFEDMKSKLN
jgi:hypothetical protein